MISARQWSANKQNALKSSGPRSAEGKLRASNNALKHGLASKAVSSQVERRRMDKIVLRLTAGSNDAWMIDRAQRVADCHLQLERVKVLVRQLIHELGQAQDPSQIEALSKRLVRLGNYERRARSRRKAAVRDFLMPTSVYAASLPLQ